MKKILLPLLFALIALAPKTHAQEVFVIDSFSTEIQINPDSSLTVGETIEVDFSQFRHGIFRDIRAEDLTVDVQAVEDENGNRRPYSMETWSGGPRVKIGDPDKTITGKQTYRILYGVKGGMRFFDDHDELYWNSTGNEWSTTIEKAATLVHLPDSAKGTTPTFKCYTGPQGSTDENCHFAYDKTKNQVLFQADAPLDPQNGLTIVVGIPKGSVNRPASIVFKGDQSGTAMIDGESFCDTDCTVNYVAPGPHQITIRKFGYSTDTRSVILEPGQSLEESFELRERAWYPFFAILCLILFLLAGFQPAIAWWRKGRDKGGRGVLVPQYESPDDLIPAEMGTLVDEKADLRDLSSTIVDLAVRGYLKIVVLPKALGILFKEDDYELVRLDKPKPRDPGLNEFEKAYMTALFGSGTTKKISDLKNVFYAHLPSLKEQLYSSLVKKGYFDRSPDKVRGLYYLKGILLIFATPLIFTFLLFIPMGFLLAPMAFMNGILTLIFAGSMPSKTAKGTEAYEHVLGFKHYLNVAEKDRLKFQEDENIFYKFLPFAMTLGIADKWSKAFKDTFNQPPDWYQGGTSGPFHPMAFTHSLNTFTSHASSTFTSAPGGSGGSGFSGGSSGGGGGGGGGGSW